MTSTKVLYFIAAVVPFGCLALALFAVFHTIRQHRKMTNAVKAYGSKSGNSNFDARQRNRDPLFQQGRCLVLR